MVKAQLQRSWHLYKSGAWQEAAALAREVIAHAGYMEAEAVHILAAIAFLEGKTATTLALIGRLMQGGELLCASQEVQAGLYQLMGRALLAERQLDAAKVAFETSITYSSQEAAAYGGLGEVLLALDHNLSAASVLEKAVRLAPKQPVLWAFLAQAQQAEGAFDDALRSLEEIVRLCPRDGETYGRIGGVLQQMGRWDEAAYYVEKALSLGGASAELLGTVALVRLGQGRVEEALETAKHASTQAPNNMEICLNYGTILYEAGLWDEAEVLFCDVEQQVGRASLRARAAFNRAAIALGRGEWQQGWALYEQRRSFLPTYVTRPLAGVPLWDGSEGQEPIALYGEQGLGDMVQFLRFLPYVTARRPVRLDIPETLRGLIDLMSEDIKARVVDVNSVVVAQQSLLSLPHCLGLKTPPHAPYLTLPSQEKMDGKEPCIGLCWAGNPAYYADKRRSIPVELFSVLQGQITGRFISLQKGSIAPSWMEQVPLETLRELADAIGQCALVITVDTVVAHIAAAMGKPVWLLQRKGGEGRWRQGGWYDHVRLFESSSWQPGMEGWASTMQEVAVALKVWRSAER